MFNKDLISWNEKLKHLLCFLTIKILRSQRNFPTTSQNVFLIGSPVIHLNPITAAYSFSYSLLTNLIGN